PLAAGGADQLVAIDERRFGVVPRAVPAAEVGGEVLLPAHRPLGGVEADEVAVLADGVDPFAVHGRGAARAGVTAAGLADRRRPELGAAGAVDGEHLAGAAGVAHGEDAVAGDGNGREALAQAGRLPDEFRAVLGPLGQQAGLFRDA